MNYKGQYSETLMYSPGDVVTWHGSSFVSMRMNQGVAPNSGGMWAMIAAAGTQGSPGSDGRNGEPGRPGAGVAPGGVSGQVLAKQGSDDYATAWVDYGPAAMGAAAADHSHAIENVIGLSDVLGGKANASHVHPVEQITGLDERLATRALMKHGHSANDVQGGELHVNVVDAAMVNIESTTISDGVISTQSEMRHSVLGVGEMIVRHGGVWVANTINAGGIRTRAGAPSSKTASGQPGEIRVSKTHLYVCVEENSWKRVALQDW
jgi:hypothetical protein